MDGKVQKGWKLYRDNLGIPALDNLFVLESDSMRVVASGEDEDESENSGEGSESIGNKGKVLVETENVEMAEVANV